MNQFVFVLIVASFCSSLSSAKQVGDLHDALSSNLIQSVLAKEICSCVFVDRIGPENLSVTQRADLCQNVMESPVPEWVLSASLIRIVTDNSIQFTTSGLGSVISTFEGSRAIALYEGPEKGCRLLSDEEVESF